MRVCPKCGTAYTDETLRFCLADGNLLNSVSDEQITISRTVVAPDVDRTVAMHEGTVRVAIPAATADPNRPRAAVPPPDSGGRLLKVLLILVGLAIAAGLAIVGGGIIYNAATRSEVPPANSNSKTPPSPAPTKDEQAELREQIANLEKRLNEQQKTGQNTNIPLKMPGRAATSTTATVDSPGDGFLALRSLPSSTAGERILKIPHGATVTIGACGPVVTPVKRSGRWCQASYGGYDGWVFDSYLRY